MKPFSIYTLIIIVLLSGCAKKEISENTQNSAHINVDEPEVLVHDFTEDQLSDAEVTELENLITPMEMETLYKMVEDFYEVRSLNEITDISSIKLIRKNSEKWQSRILNIEDADTVNEIVKVLKNSEVYYLGATSYEDLLILTKKDGSEIELQIPPYYPGLYVGEGFILGDAVYYSPGTEEWLEIMLPQSHRL